MKNLFKALVFILAMVLLSSFTFAADDYVDRPFSVGDPVVQESNSVN